MRCEEVRESLPAYVREPESSLALRRHLGSCSDCRAELDRYQDLVANLAALRSVAVEPPVGLKASLAAIPSEANRLEMARRNVAAARGHITAHRGAYLGGLAVAVAGATGAALWRNARARRIATA
jgi:predicted anti-sigma-YlaC factor YlaD